jgi:hypothetical protein
MSWNLLARGRSAAGREHHAHSSDIPFHGPEADLDVIAKATLGTTLTEIKSALP